MKADTKIWVSPLSFSPVYFFLFSTRCLVTVNPYSSAFEWMKFHNTHLLVAVWVIGILYPLFSGLNMRTSNFLAGHQLYKQCAFDDSSLWDRHFFYFHFCTTYFFPSLIIVFSYFFIIKHLVHNDHFVAKNLSSNDKRCSIYVERVIYETFFCLKN